MFGYTHAFVRPIAQQSFQKALSITPPSSPIDVELAIVQHHNYVSQLAEILGKDNIITVSKTN